MPIDSNPLVFLIYLLIAGYIARLWLQDYQTVDSGKKTPHSPIPGAFPANWKAITIAVAGSILLILLQTAGEYQLESVDQQSIITWAFLPVMLAAAIIEEVLFRGYLVVDRKGKAWLWSSILTASALFALLHFHWFDWNEGAPFLTLTPTALWWTLCLLLNSVWWYTVRFFPLNPDRSLIPCVAGHAAANLTVFIIKCSQGMVSGIY